MVRSAVWRLSALSPAAYHALPLDTGFDAERKVLVLTPTEKNAPPEVTF